jgi:hypothetical protein
MKKILASTVTSILMPAVAMAHTTSSEVGHLHPHGMVYGMIALICAAVIWRVLRRN